MSVLRSQKSFQKVKKPSEMEGIIFARVSTEEQKREGHSIPAQVAKMRDYCQKKEIQIAYECEVDESSTIEEREKFLQVIDKIKSGSLKYVLVVETVDRLQRSFKESVILDDLRKQDKVEIHFLRENLIISKDSTSSDMMRWDMGVMFARNYVLQLSDNVKRSIQQKLRNGEFIGRAPFGYKNITLEGGKTEIVGDPYGSSVVKRSFELYATGTFSMQTLRDKLNADYQIKWSQGKMDAVLKNPFYYGMMLVKGKLYSHKYPPIISRDLFDRVQEVKNGHQKRNFKYKGLPYIYRGMIRCAHCGLAITPEKHKGHVYYHCTEYRGKHGAEWVREEEITRQITEVFKKVEIPSNVIAEITEGLKGIHEGKMTFREEEVKKLMTEKEKYAKRLEGIYLHKLDGSITESEYTKYYTQFRAELAKVQAQLDLVQDAEDNYYITSKYVLELANKAHTLFLSSEAEEKRMLIGFLLQNLKLEGKQMTFESEEPFKTIFSLSDHPEWRPLQDMFLNREITFSFKRNIIETTLQTLGLTV